jgi:ATP-binding protein involved in chromosome partitioning
VALTLFQKLKVTGGVIVTTPQDVALMDVYKSVSMCQKLNVSDPRRRREHEPLHRLGGREARDLRPRRRRAHRRVREGTAPGQVPLEQSVREWSDAGTPVVQAAPGSAAAVVLAGVAEKLTERIARDRFERSGGERVPGDGPKRLRILR